MDTLRRRTSIPDAYAVAWYRDGNIARWAYAIKSNCILYRIVDYQYPNTRYDVVSVAVTGPAAGIDPYVRTAWGSLVIPDGAEFPNEASALRAAQDWAGVNIPITYRLTTILSITGVAPDCNWQQSAPSRSQSAVFLQKTASWVCLRRGFYPLLFNHLAMVGQSDFSS